MKTQFLILFILLSFQAYAQCADDECGPHPGMPNYLCSDSVTVAGPGNCIQNSIGQCYWEIIACPSITGYLRSIEASFCMDECSYYYIENEVDSGFGYINVIPDSGILNLDLYLDRFVSVDLGPQINCVECSAFEIAEISLSDDCQYPVDCFQDPCIVESCLAYPNSECVSHYCDGCYADFYDENDNLVNCYEESNCYDLTDLFFGWCDMYLGVGYAYGACQNLSGCGWDINGADYSDAFFESIDECEQACGDGYMTCDEVAEAYESLHVEQYAGCSFDNDCMSVWGHCDVGLGGCHYSVNKETYPEDEINSLVDMWVAGDCVQGVCDCSAEPYAQCIDGICISSYCMSDNPAGCYQTGCDVGYDCIINENECVPSWCGCDGFYGEWFCTEDCGGGSCVIAGFPGDLNGDGQINVVDIVVAVNYIIIGDYYAMGDLNGDSTLNVLDIIIIVNIILNS